MKKINIDRRQHTKIVATVGPASNSPEMLLKLIQEGVNVFRLNFSHGTHEDHKTVIDRIEAINKEYGIHIGILGDLQGPKLRVGLIEEGTVLEEGDIITFTNEECVGNKHKAYMSYPQFASDVKVGEKVLINDGKLVFEVLETNGKSEVKLKTLFGGEFSSRKGVNLPETKISQPSLTDKDKKDLAFMLTQPINWIALSFVREAEDIIELKNIIADAERECKVIAKIEKPEAVTNIDAIIEATDAVMVARGDLGVEVPIEKMPHIQKSIIQKCLKLAKPVIVATQMMESMIENPSPTRAEVTDVANAVLDGADAVMLSGESSVGKHPALVVKAMNSIIAETEKHFEWYAEKPEVNQDSKTYYSDVICYSAANIADEISAKGIIGVTVSGYTAFKVSSFRPKSKIYIFSYKDNILKTLNLIRGVECHKYDKFTTTDETIYDLNEILMEHDRVQKGDTVINTGSMPLIRRGRTNMCKITIV